MSYWTSVDDPDEGEVFSENMTSNVSRLWADALQLPDKPYLRDGEPVMVTRTDPETGEKRVEQLTTWGLALLDKSPCSEVGGILARAVERAMSWTPEKIASYDAPNGWGSGEQARSYLVEILRAVVEHPRGTLHVHH